MYIIKKKFSVSVFLKNIFLIMERFFVGCVKQHDLAWNTDWLELTTITKLCNIIDFIIASQSFYLASIIRVPIIMKSPTLLPTYMSFCFRFPLWNSLPPFLLKGCVYPWYMFVVVIFYILYFIRFYYWSINFHKYANSR